VFAALIDGILDPYKQKKAAQLSSLSIIMV